MVLGFSLPGFFGEVRIHVPSVFSGQLYTFQTADGAVAVHVEDALAHSSGIAARARCALTGEEFDLRRLRISAKMGALVTLEALESLERQSELALGAGSHLHIVRCHATLVENIGVEHCRLLLCAACSMDLATHLRARGNALASGAVAELGEQLSLGLRHLHSLSILCGSLTPQNVLLGCDGKWKLLGDLRFAAMLPLRLDEWRRRCFSLSSDERPMLPPEVEQDAVADDEHSTMVACVQDVWMLGGLLSHVFDGIDCRCLSGIRAGNAVLFASQDVLLCSYAARFWMLLHWLLAKEPSQRPSSRRLVDIMHSLLELSPHDLLIEMPEYARFHCQSMATAAARNLAYASMARVGANMSCAAGLPLEVLRMSLLDSSVVDQLCKNCGLELGDYPSDEAEADIPLLVPVPQELAADACKSGETAKLGKEDLHRPHTPGSSCVDTDESTDAGSSSGDESNISCRSPLHRSRRSS